MLALLLSNSVDDPPAPTSSGLIGSAQFLEIGHRLNPENVHNNESEPQGIETANLANSGAIDPGANNISRISLTGTIHTDSGGNSGYDRVVLYSPTSGKSYRTVSSLDGYFRIDNVVQASDYMLRIIPHGMYRQHVSNPLQLVLGQMDLSIWLEPLPVATLEGRIVNPQGRPIPGFGVKVRSPEKSIWSQSAITDIEGRFQVNDVPLGELEFSSTFGQPLRITGHKFTGDPHTRLTLVVDHGPHELRGLVFDHSYNLVGDADVLLGWEISEDGKRSIVNRYTTTDAQGQFVLKGIGIGEHDLLLTTALGETHRQTVNVGNAYADLTVFLPPPAVTN